MISTSTSALLLLILMLQSCLLTLPALGQQVDPEVCMETFGTATLPSLPSSFHVTMATNIQPVNQLGHVTIMVDANLSRSAVDFEVPYNKELKAIFDSATRQVLIIDRRDDNSFDVENCEVANVTAASLSSVMARVGYRGDYYIIPTEKFFNGSGLKIDPMGTEKINGMDGNKFRTCHYANNLLATLEVTWWFSSGTKEPMQVKTRYRDPSTNTILDIVYVLSPLRSVSSRHHATRHPFQAPTGVYCKGLISVKTAPMITDRFSLTLDRFMYNLPGQPSQLGPDSFRESYDQRGNITMLEGEGLSFSLNKTKYGGGVVARINDFTRGISYVKNLRFGNCTYEKIPDVDWDSDPNPNGAKIKSPDEFYFPSLAELQYKGTGLFRTVEVDVYIGYKDNVLNSGDGRKYPLTTEYYLAIKVSYDAIGRPVYKSVPLATFTKSSNTFYAWTEIIDFSPGVPKSYDHDISECFSATQKLHFELILSTSDLDSGYVQYLSEYRSEFMYSLVNSLAKAINISPLRIVQPTVSLFAEPLILVEITVTERANVPNYTPKLPELPLADVASTMTDLAAKNNLDIDVMEGDLVFAVPIMDFVSMDSRGQGPAPPGGMSSGAAAGLSIGMILLGIVIGVAGIFLFGYFRKGPQSGFQPFGGAAQET